MTLSFNPYSLWSMHAKARPCFQNFTPTGVALVYWYCSPVLPLQAEPKTRATTPTESCVNSKDLMMTGKDSANLALQWNLQLPTNCRVHQFSNDQPLENKLLEL